MSRIALIASGIFGFMGIILGATGAHALKKSLDPAALASFHTGVKYHMWHALFLFALGILLQTHSGKLLTISLWSCVGGIILFSGSIYLNRLAGIEGITKVTPFGGLLLIAAWLLLALHFILNK